MISTHAIGFHTVLLIIPNSNKSTTLDPHHEVGDCGGPILPHRTGGRHYHFRCAHCLYLLHGDNVCDNSDKPVDHMMCVSVQV
mmetsp:Transcript_15169/g.33880  ORF Transcript_15169/g.33880 Transcript_15169/m.33880 type:complete len:83 (+) Transcript_15169:193-441(+)